MTTAPDGYVVITPGEVYHEVLATRAAVNALSYRMDAVLVSLPDTIKDQETRLRNLEMRVWMAVGVVALIVSAATVFAPLIM